MLTARAPICGKRLRQAPAASICGKRLRQER
jgi:hypothetical protein